MRVFAGPNGSGKTTILKQIDHNFNLGFYVNADEIEQFLRSSNSVDLGDFGINSVPEDFSEKFYSHSIYAKASSEGFNIDLKLEGTVIHNPDKNTHSYEAALVADLIRQLLLNEGEKFAYETVMSHESKIDFMKKSIACGYKNYLYFISTESSLINVERVKQRVELGGHPVKESKIVERYERSMGLLKSAVKQTYRSFIFDNSGKTPKLVLEVTNGELIEFRDQHVPVWVDKYLLF